MLADAYGDTGAYVVRSAAALRVGGADPGYEVDVFGGLRLMLWPSILAAVAVRLPPVAVMAMSWAWMVVPWTVLLVLALLCWVEPMLTETLTPMAAPLLGRRCWRWRPDFCRKVAASAVALSRPAVGQFRCVVVGLEGGGSFEAVIVAVPAGLDGVADGGDFAAHGASKGSAYASFCWFAGGCWPRPCG